MPEFFYGEWSDSSSSISTLDDPDKKTTPCRAKKRFTTSSRVWAIWILWKTIFPSIFCRYKQITMAGDSSDGENEKKQTSDSENGKKEIENEKQIPLNMSSPYYLHPSDHPGMNICPVILMGDNYQEWEISMRNAFRAKRKLCFVDGTVTAPAPDASNIEDWWSVNSMLVAWIIQSIDPSLRSTITYYDTIKEL